MIGFQPELRDLNVMHCCGKICWREPNLDQAVHEVVPHVVPDAVVAELHAVAVLRVKEVFVGVAACVATTPHIPAYCTPREDASSKLSFVPEKKFDPTSFAGGKEK